MLRSLPLLSAQLLRQAPALLLASFAGAWIGSSWLDQGEPSDLSVSAFALEQEVVVPGDANAAFDAFTGDILPWWDHHYSPEPLALVIDPRPGGHFYETFDEEGNGVIHATVTLARRGSELIFRGPLGFGAMGVHFDMVHRVTFVEEPTEDGGVRTRVAVAVHGLGEIQDGWAQAVQGVWKHFLVEQFEPYVSSGKHLEQNAR